MRNGRRVAPEVQRLRLRAIGHSLFPATGLMASVDRLGFVQADPIRSPARAQDLILRQRVLDYRAGDLERRFAELEVEEDYLYAYGFVPRRIWRLMHPRSARGMSALERKVLAAVRADGAVIHPKQLEAQFGKKRVVNAWGGLSKATTRALDLLQYRGLLRVAHRDSGIRVYRAVTSPAEPAPPADRLRGLVLAVADVLAPVPARTLHGIAARLRRSVPAAPDHRAVIRELIAGGELETVSVDQVVYLWPATSAAISEPARRARFLAPFDPVVWDRGRFEQFFGWSYRFEAYTPPAQRVRGYYAMPLLWIDRVVGWANASVIDGALRVELGFAAATPRERDFRREVDAEIARLEAFLDLRPVTVRAPGRY